MVEVTRDNFPDVLEALEKQIPQASFISVDCEFSKLPQYSSDSSLFVDLNARYKELLATIDDSVTLQVGLALFKYNRDLDQYEASVYKFHVCPSFCGRLFDPSISFNGSSVSFLCLNKFDFNKAFYNGVHCLNRRQERLIRSKATHEGFLSQALQKMSLEENDTISDILEDIKTNIENSAGIVNNDGSYKEYDIPYTKTDNPLFRFVLRRLIRKNFPHLEIVDLRENQIVVVQRGNDEISADDNDIDLLIDELKGFSKVYDLLVRSKKPLVGHNTFCDLLIMYNQFHDNLPGNYESFKSNVHSLFPCVFDTKFISREVKSNDDKIRNRSLKDLYGSLRNSSLGVNVNVVILSNEKVGDEHFHDASWDAYVTGYCFLGLASTRLKMDKSDRVFHSSTFSELLKSVDCFKNRINIGNADIPYICIGRADPVSRRPPFLHVKLKSHASHSFDELDAILANYGNCQKKQISATCVLVALPNYPSFKEAVRDLSLNDKFKVERYSILKHNRLFQTCLLTSLLLSSGLTWWMKYRR